jgi:hypothetical protein
MIPLLVRSAALLTALAALPIFLIRAQPYDDHHLREFLAAPDECPAPCFMGIRPGVTTVEEALLILQGHPWVSNQIESREFSRIVVVWGSSESSLIDTESSGRLSFAGGVIQNINFRTHITLGDLWAGFGQVDWATQIPASINRPPGLAYRVGYHQTQALFSFFVPTVNGRVPFDDLISARLTVNFGAFDTNALIPEPSLWHLWQGLASPQRG